MSAVAKPVAPPPAEAPRAGAVQERGVAYHASFRAERWSALGVVKVAREVDVGDAELDGTVSVGGAWVGRQLRCRGSLEVVGPFELRETLSGRGELRAGSTVRAGAVAFRGRVAAGGAVTADRAFDLSGELRAPSLTAANVRFEGFAEIPGTVRAPEIELRLRDGSRVGPLEGGTVRVLAHAPNLVDRVLGRVSTVTVDRIEAERAVVEGVDVGFLRAREIRLGPGCHVTAAEGTIVARHPTSRVGPESRSLAPYGLRR